MSNEQYEAYKALYSEYIERSIELHNYHQAFMKTKGYRTIKQLKNSIKKIMILEKKLARAGLLAYKECLVNYKINKQRQKEELKAWKAANKGKPGRPKGKKNGHNDSTTSKTI